MSQYSAKRLKSTGTQRENIKGNHTARRLESESESEASRSHVDLVRHDFHPFVNQSPQCSCWPKADTIYSLHGLSIRVTLVKETFPCGVQSKNNHNNHNLTLKHSDLSAEKEGLKHTSRTDFDTTPERSPSSECSSVRSCFRLSPSSPPRPPPSAGFLFRCSVEFPQSVQLLHRYLRRATEENSASSCFGCAMANVLPFCGMVADRTTQWILCL